MNVLVPFETVSTQSLTFVTPSPEIPLAQQGLLVLLFLFLLSLQLLFTLYAPWGDVGACWNTPVGRQRHPTSSCIGI